MYYQGVSYIENSANVDKSYDGKALLRDFWPSRKRKYENMTEDEVRSYVRHMELPMARVKKIMKLDDSVRNQMISGDAPLVLSAAAEMFIQEITLRAWNLVDEGRRKTLQKCDIVAACSRSETFDFLIDIVPRDDSRRNQVVKLAQYASDEANPANNQQSQPVQYVMADCETSGNNVIQLDNGQVLHATAIGQPIPITDPTVSFDISQMQLPTGVQFVQMQSQQ
ncbi:unnamed protein product [Auanema sp. JU1783]|nr:unnamed protein product [Auanema sp. JU1783]